MSHNEKDNRFRKNKIDWKHFRLELNNTDEQDPQNIQNFVLGCLWLPDQDDGLL